jgi:hypothetical protein
MQTDKTLIRDCIRIIDDTIYDMFAHDFKYLKEELISVKSKLNAILQG